MADKLFNELPEYTGNTQSSWLIMNNSGETTTYKVKKETYIGDSGTSGTSGSSGTSGTGFSTVQNYGLNRFLISDNTPNGAIALSGITFDDEYGSFINVDDVFIKSLNHTSWTRGDDTKITTGIPYYDRYKFKPLVTYSGGTITASLVINDPDYVFGYYINDKKFWVNSQNIFAYSASKIASEGVWFFYIDSSTAYAPNQVMILSQTPWNINDADVLLFNFYFNASDNTITWIGEERHTAGRDIFQHARNHAQGAIYKNGFNITTYNGLTNLSGDTTNNFGRAQFKVANGSFYDEDILNNIRHSDLSITSTTTNPFTDWNLNVQQFLGFTDTNTSTTAGTITFPIFRTLITGQAVSVFLGAAPTVRGTFIVTSGGTSTSFLVTTVTGTNDFADGDIVEVGARIPIYYVDSVSGTTYIWRKLESSDFLGVTSGSSITIDNITNAIPQINNVTTGGFVNMTDDRYYPMFLVATNVTSEPIIAILGQGQSSSNNLNVSLTEKSFQFSNLIGLNGLSLQEFVPFSKIVFKYNSTQTESVIKLVYNKFITVRFSSITGSFLGSDFINYIFVDIKKVVSAQRVDNTPFFFNSILRTGDTSSSVSLDTAILITTTENTKISLDLRSDQPGTNSITVDLYLNMDGTDFSTATSVDSLTLNLEQNIITRFEFDGTNLNLYDSIHIRVQPTSNPGNVYGVIIIE